jgi:hypothetical protein
MKFSAFPHYLSEDIIQLNRKLNLQSTYPDSYCFEVLIDEERIDIPYRIYLDLPSQELIELLTAKQTHILNCYLTRHHNGYIREQFLRKIMILNEPWVIPYISQLIGEYILEILIVINNNIENIQIKEYTYFFKHNPLFFPRLKQRVISYWDCYYKNEFMDFNEYIGNKIIKHFESELR